MKMIRREETLIYAFDESLPVEHEIPLGYRLVPLNLSNIEEIFADVADEWRRREYPGLLRGGCLGLALRDDRGWAAVQWIAPAASNGPPHLPRRLTRGRTWCFNEHTRAEHRNRGLWRSLKAIGIQSARALDPVNANIVYSDTGSKNVASRVAHERFGFSPRGVAITYRLRIPMLLDIKVGRWNRERRHPDRAGEL